MAYPPAAAAYPAQPVHDPTDVLGRRIVAYLIDVVLAGALSVVAFVITKSASYDGVDIDDACEVLRNSSDFNDACVQFGSTVYTWTGERFALALLLSLLATAANHVLLQGMTGATVGKLMLGLRVVDPQGRRCGIGRALVRWILLFVDQFFCALVGLISVFVTHPHRRVGDMAANTYVIATVDFGRPVVPPPPAYAPPVYAQPGVSGWQPPQPGAPAPWPGPPAGADWGAPPQEAMPQQPPAPSWGAEPPNAWSAPAPAVPPTPPLPEPPQQQWGTPAPPPPAAAPTQPEPPAPPGPPPEGPAPDSWWNDAVADDANERDE